MAKNPNLQDKVFCDLFAGTSAVGRHFKKQTKKIIANDQEFYSFVLAQNYIVNSFDLSELSSLFDELNDERLTPLVSGKICQFYSPSGTENRRYFTEFNAQKIDAIRMKIKKLKDEEKLNLHQYYFILASLLESADRVANTASVYASFLKNFKKTATNKFILEPAKFEISQCKHEVFQKNANELITNIQGDILYIDPPYNNRQYGSNYHVLNTIALYDDFTPRGKTGLREYNSSLWCSKKHVADELEYLIDKADFAQIFLSYNDDGILSQEKIKKIMEKFGKYEIFSTPHRRFKADSNRKCKEANTTEFLHFLQKN